MRDGKGQTLNGRVRGERPMTNNFKKSAPRLAALAAFALLVAGGTAGRAVAQTPGAEQEALSAARAATAQYHNESKALEDGFLSTFLCVGAPGLGAMGVHYINPSRMMDANVDAASPETLLYVPQSNGRMRLVGVEYYAPVLVGGQPWFGGPDNPPPTVDNPAPTLFGRVFDGPMPGHGPGQPWHYDLHVWAWSHNPAGLFAPFNPKLKCGQAGGANHLGGGGDNGWPSF
jgi:hypothetical protein